MSTSPDMVLLVGNPRPRSRTRGLGERLAGLLGEARPDVLELADLTGVTFSDQPAVAVAPDPDGVERVRAATVLIVATPAYKGTITGLLKLFLDRMPHQGLSDVIAVPVAVAGSPAHARATADDLARLLMELGARVPTSVTVLESELDNPKLSDAVHTVRHALAWEQAASKGRP